MNAAVTPLPETCPLCEDKLKRGAPMRPCCEARLRWFYFTAAGLFEKSTSGGMFYEAGLIRLRRVPGSPDSAPEYYRASLARPTEVVLGSQGQRIGERDAVDVEITGDEYEEPGYTPDEDSMTAFAVVSRRLAALGALSEAFRAYYGHEGGHMEDPESGDALPTVYAILLLTDEGNAALELAAKIDSDRAEREHVKRVEHARKKGKPIPKKAPGANLELRPYQRVRELAFALSRPKYEPVRPLFAAGVQRAEELYAEACRIWNTAPDSRRAPVAEVSSAPAA